MRRVRIYPFLGILVCVVFVCTATWGEKVRSAYLTLVSSLKVDRYFATSVRETDPIVELQRENQILVQKIQQIQDWLLQEDRIEEQMARYRELEKKEGSSEQRAYFQRRQQQIAGILQMQMKALPARVIYRDPSFWSSFLWINVGSQQNQALGAEVIAKQSPVLVRNVLVGIIEEVQETRSKVRLISDSQLVPAVRVLRSDEEGLLAKGELHGSSLPLWRSRGQKLIGLGFNYDFADLEGKAKNLREPPLLIQEGDVLVTSGLDGVFPPGLEVALVEKVDRLREGEISYSIEARSLVPSLDAIEHVMILPPL